jgi:hypothetical protein
MNSVSAKVVLRSVYVLNANNLASTPEATLEFRGFS